MGEVWVAAVATVGSAYMSSRAAAKGQDKQIAADKETARVQAQEERRTMLYGSQLEDSQNQMAKQRRLDARYKHAGIRGKAPPVLGTATPEMPADIIEPAKKKK